MPKLAAPPMDPVQMARTPNFSAKRRVADLFIKRCGLRRLYNTNLQKLIRTVLDEIDLQHLRDNHPCYSCADRTEMYRYVNASILKATAIDFLEFGVFRGESISEWISINKDRASRFYGFDSFEGLPENWRQGQDKGHFDVGGNIPQIDSSQVQSGVCPQKPTCAASRCGSVLIHFTSIDLFRTLHGKGIFIAIR
jgi:hypothetical protein